LLDSLLQEIDLDRKMKLNLQCMPRIQRRFKHRHTTTRLYQPKELIPHASLATARKVEEHTSNSTRLLIENGLIKSTATGYFALLPLATRSLNKLIRLIDEELEMVACQKIVLPHVAPAKLWAKSGRLESIGPELVTFKDRHNKSMVLSPTHEESITKLISTYDVSVNELPLRLYQIGAKFRAEMKPRFGLLRSNEFVMKDLYTFDKSVEDAEATYNEISTTYRRILMRIGVPFHRVSGDSGTIGGSISHEYHYPASIGQDELLICTRCEQGRNAELVAECSNNADDSCDVTNTSTEKRCPSCGGTLKLSKGIEVGHTFLLGQKYSKVFQAQFSSRQVKTDTLEMGCYGIGVTRLLAAAVEVLSTESELRWPRLLAPFTACIVTPKVGSLEYSGMSLLDDIYNLTNSIFPNDVIIDDRPKVSIGKKYHEARRTGYPLIIIMGKKSAGSDPRIELHLSADNDTIEVRPCELVNLLQSLFQTADELTR